MASRDDIKFLSNPKIGSKRNKYCRFRKFGIKHIDYKDTAFLEQFVNEQGKILPRRDANFKFDSHKCGSYSLVV